VGDARRPSPGPYSGTRGWKFHWFGYYEKRQFDPTDRYVLGMQAEFEQQRQPTPEDVIKIGTVDLRAAIAGSSWATGAPGAGNKRACCSGCPLRRPTETRGRHNRAA
jgi:hypothetical protein